MVRIYRSKIDRWLFVTLALTSAVSIAAIIPVVARGSLLGLLIAAFTFGLGVLLPLSCVYIRYTLGLEALDVRCGFFRWRIPLVSIEQVRPTRTDWTSSPAGSLDRLKIQYRIGRARHFLMISPEEREAFLRHLVEIAPELSRNGDRIVRGHSSSVEASATASPYPV